MSHARLMVIGDLILDEFIWGKVERISPEAPVPVVRVERESLMPGGAANVASNVQTLGGTACLIGLVGQDDGGRRLKTELTALGIPTDSIVTDPDRPTISKTRVVAHHQQVVRIDREQDEKISGASLQAILEQIQERIQQVDGIIIEDYGKGLIHPQLLKPVVAWAKKYKKIITVDPKQENIAYYRGVTALTPNRNEAAVAAGCPITDDASLNRAAVILLKKLKPELLLVTLSEDGMALFFGDGRKPVKIPTVAREVFDVSGAGDTVIAAFTLARAAGASFLEAAQLANAAAGVVVGKVGTATCSPKELEARIFGK